MFMSEITWNLSLKQTPILEMASTSLHLGMHIMIYLGSCAKYPPKKTSSYTSNQIAIYITFATVELRVVSSNQQLPIDMHIVIPKFRNKVEMQTLEEANKVKDLFLVNRRSHRPSSLNLE